MEKYPYGKTGTLSSSCLNSTANSSVFDSAFLGLEHYHPVKDFAIPTSVLDRENVRGELAR